MKLGIFLSTSDDGARPEDVAVAVEERGFESLWVPEHTHIPVSRRTPFPGGGELPRDYSHLADPFVVLAAAAARTERIRLGTAICLVVEHDPIVLAKTVATLDVLSRGRFCFGVGGGWNREEMENHGTAFATRWALLRERIEAMKRIWTEDEPEYHGRRVDFDPIWSWPKPAQRPHPPILLGSATAAGRKRVARYCDGWLPVGLRPSELALGMADLRAQAEAAGRDPDSIGVSLFWAPTELDPLQRIAALGVERAILSLPARSLDSTLRRLDRYADLGRKLASPS